MKTWRKRIVGFVALIASSLIITRLFWQAPLPDGSIPAREIVSYCVGDTENDGILKLFAISGNSKIDTGERCGEFLLVCDASVEDDMGRLGYIPPEKIYHRIDLAGIQPMKVQLGDINGDSVNELSICVYKTAKFHPVMDKRPFFFQLIEGNLIPIWLGSRLSRPFDDYILLDIDADGIDEIVSVEVLESGQRVIAAYKWRGFGFELFSQSEELDGELLFNSDTAGQTTEAGEISVIFMDNREHNKLIFCLNNGSLQTIN